MKICSVCFIIVDSSASSHFEQPFYVMCNADLPHMAHHPQKNSPSVVTTPSVQPWHRPQEYPHPMASGNAMQHVSNAS